MGQYQINPEEHTTYVIFKFLMHQFVGSAQTNGTPFIRRLVGRNNSDQRRALKDGPATSPLF